MRLLPAGWRLTGALALCCIGLAGLLAAQWQGYTLRGAAGIVDGKPPANPSGPLPPLPASLAPPAMAAFDEILNRPLFTPDRRPEKTPEPEAPVEVPVETPVEPLNVRLEGVARVGASRIAVLRDLQSNQGLRLSEGMEYNGWKLERVEREKAVLTRDGQTQEILLEIQRQ
jgi:hypothetical protein